MRAAMERWLLRRWYGGATPGPGLRALAGLYRLLQDARPAVIVQRLPVPVLVVGNFTAGGTGKTPLVISLAEYFLARGFRPGIVSRGHGRRGAAPLQVSASTSVEACGDESKLMFERTGRPVFVDRDRVAAAQAAIAAGCDLVIADDGLQHRRLGRDIEIEVIDGERGYGNGLLIPAGPLRERPRPCDFRVVTGQSAKAGEWAMQLELGDAVSLAPGLPARALADFGGTPVHAVAGIGNPQRFFAALRQAGLAVVEHAFEDHHAFVAADFAGLSGPILMTEKDAVKCRALGLASAWSVPADARISPDFFLSVEQRLKPSHAAA